MRWNQLRLDESLAKYRPMFTSLYADGRVPKEVEQMITKIERAMKREDRIVWMLRWYRANLVYHMVKNPYDLSEEEERLVKRVLRDLTPKGASQVYTLSGAANQGGSAVSHLGDFEHLFSLPVAKINQLVFDRQPPRDLIDELYGYEADWQSDLKDNAVEIRYGDEKIIDFGNGWAWWHLPRAYCREEGEAMGHCGNTASYDSGDTILSLRQHVHEDHWEPHLTFILDQKGYLGEMKGKANEKPVERYHAMIVALLKNDVVFGIKSGGYLPENNFSLSDLTPAEQKELKTSKPGFRSLSQLMREGDWDAVETVLRARLDGYDYEKIDMAEKEIIISSWPSTEYFVSSELWDYKQGFNNIDLALRGYEDGEDVYDQFHTDYYQQIIETHVYDFLSYKADVSIEWRKEKIVLSMSFGSFDDCSDPANEETYVDSLDEKYDDTSISERSPEFFDDIDEAVCLYIDDLRRGSVSGVAELIYNHYKGDEGHSWGSYTTSDPRQMRFDF